MQAFVNFITMQFQLCSVFFTFSLGTRTHYFGRTILHGGAKVGPFLMQCLSIVILAYNFVFVVENFTLILIFNFFITSIEQLEGVLWYGTLSLLRITVFIPEAIL